MAKRKSKHRSGKADAKGEEAGKDLPALSPNPMTNMIVADIAIRGGEMLLNRAVEEAVLGAKYGAKKGKKVVKGRSMGQTLLSTAIARIATRSVPGAIVVGGALLAKTLYERRKPRVADAEGEAELDEQARKG
ncbi:MAG: hypothetical protein JF593_05545 [Novosphingobium sp.]|nr:hypothetical protein [Novosphingobium sp.]